MKRYKNSYLLWILIVLCVNINQLNAQDLHVVHGAVYTLNDLPVGNLEIRAKKSGAKVLTDSLGNFSLVCREKDILLLGGKIFEKKRVRVLPTDDYLEVEIVFIATEENKQYAIGYGYISDEKKLNAAVSMSNKNIFCSYSDIYSAIKGRFTNVQVNVRDESIIIRGMSSNVGDNNALLVVDGQIVQSISNIDPCQVSSIDIIKDGTSAIYGMQGANGVVIIELRKEI